MKLKYTLSAITAAAIMSSTLVASDVATQADIDELWEVLDKVETKAFTDKLNWSAEIRGRMDNFSYDNNGIGNQIGKPYDASAPKAERREMAFPQKKNWDPHYSIRGYLNMNTQLEDISFTGRLRFDHSSQGNQRLCILSPQDVGKELPASSTTKFTAFDMDRFYFDLSVMKNSIFPMVVTGGILPTTGGMSSNIIENTPRRSVFPSLIFDSNVYGGILTMNFSELTGLDNAYIRAVIGKGYTLNDEMFYYQCNRENIQDMGVLGLFAEFKIPMGINNIFWFGIVQDSNIKATPFLGGDGAENAGSNTKIKSQQDLGDILNYGLGLEIQKMSVPGGKLDLFAHYAVSNPSKNGNCVNYTDQAGDAACKVGADANPSPYYHTEMARGTLLEDVGSSVYAGFKYEVNYSLKTKFGYEYNQGSESWWSATQGSEDVFNKLATRGKVNEAYVIQPINKNLYVRLGYMNIQEEYSGSGWHFGTPLKKDATQENFYFLFNAYF